MSAERRADYGLDAPGMVRNLILVSVVGFIAWITAAAGWWSGRVVAGHLIFPISRMAIWPAAGCGFMACWMIYDSKIGKVRDREKLLDRIRWTGAERVLDVGCGRGLLLIGAAKRLSSGSAVGIDLWQAEDLSGNRPEATLENAKIEGVADRVEVQTADMRAIPFPDAAFDVILSCAAIHNLYAPADRAKALGEIARVLKPGGRVLIDDIRHYREYAEHLRRRGCAVSRVSSILTTIFLAALTFGSLRPATLLARKAA
jgi:SAM-dependent methyltransferase